MAISLDSVPHTVSCAAAKAALNIYVKEGIAERTAELGKYAKERLENEFLPLPNVREVSGMGLLLGMSIVADKETNAEFPKEVNLMSRLREEYLKAGLFGRFHGLREFVSFAPPLIITKEEVDKALDIMYPIIAGLKDIKVK